MSHHSSQEIADFLAALRQQEVATRTVNAYNVDLSSFASWFASNTGQTFRARVVTSTNLLDYKAYLRVDCQCRPATVNRKLAAMRRFFVWARGTGLITELPTRDVKGLPQIAVARTVLTRRDTGRLLDIVMRHGSKRDLAIILLLLVTGVRVGELCNIRLGHLAISESDSHLQIQSAKRYGQRIVPLIDDVRNAVTAYLLVRPPVADDHLFIGQRGDALQTEAVQLLVRKYGQRAGLSAVTPTILRHSVAKYSLDAGVDLDMVSGFLGHRPVRAPGVNTQVEVPGTQEDAN